MSSIMEQALTAAFQKFRLPRYRELPNMGLYLEQTEKYINQCLAPLGCMQVTASMIRNYVKMGLVKNPVRKMYYNDQIAQIFAVTVLKSVLSLEHILSLFERQKRDYSNEIAYDFFCRELENTVNHQFGLQDAAGDPGEGEAEKTMLHSAIVSVSQIIYLNACFEWLKKDNARERTE